MGENVLMLDNDPYSHPPHILVKSGVRDIGASFNHPVVVNDHNIHVYRPTLTVATRDYSSR